MTLFSTKHLYFRANISSSTPFFSQFVLCHASNDTTSRNIGETDAWVVPHLKFWVTVPPVPPKSPPMLYVPGQGASLGSLQDWPILSNVHLTAISNYTDL